MGGSFKKFISVLCVLSLLIGLVPSAAFAAPAGTAAEAVSGTVKTESGEPAADRSVSFSPKTSGEEVEISTWKELMYRLQYYARSGEVIRLKADISGSNALMLLRDVQVTLDLNGHKIEKITDTAGNDECAIIIVTGRLTITDSNPNTTHEGVEITGGIITGGNCAGNGGGICVNGGSLTLAGGTITGNEAQYGGGVYVNSGCGFTMTGGVITVNRARYGGGVYICGGASFEGPGGSLDMSGGSIVSNIGQQCGGGVYIAGGSNHFAGGGSFTMSDGTVSGNISENGGGVYAVGGIVSHYNAGDGSFTMSGGSVTGNTAHERGGGVYLDGGGFTMSDGSVTGNNSDKLGEYGCVVCALNNADVRLSGGTISGNKDDYVYPSKTESFVYFDRSSSLTLAGASTLTVTDCIRLNANQSIKVESPLAAESKVHVYINTTETPKSGKPIIIAESEKDCTASFEIEHQPTGSEVIYEFGRLILRKTCNIKTWADLQSAMNSGGDWENGTGQIIRLGYDITAESENTALVFGNFTARPVTLELDGHTINRNLTAPAENGNVLTVNGGTLIIRDSQGGGSITGGNNVSNGGGIVVNGDGVNVGGGRLTLESGSISGNSSDSNGGGVCVNGGSLTMTGGSIEDNTGSDGGGVYVGGSIGDNTGSDGDSIDVGGGSFTLSGGSITDNTARSNGAGIYLNADSYLILSGGSVLNTDEVYLPTGKSIGVGSAPADDSRVEVKVQDSATRAKPVVIAISATDCRTVFEIKNQQPNTELVYEDEEVKLRLTSAATSWADLQNALDNGGTESGTEHIIRLTEDITAANDEQALEFHYTEHPVILDLNGHSINRALTQAAENGNVLTVNGGDLTIRDSSANKTGSITGGKTMTNGGGVVVSDGSLTLAGGSIRGNTAENGSGVYVGGGRFTLAGGSVSSNTANGNGSIYVKNNAQLILSGGSIAANAGSANIYPETGSNITLTSGSVLSVADSILLPAGTSVNVESAPEKGSAVRVRVQDEVSDEHAVIIAQSTVDCRACFEIENQQANTELVFEDNAVKLKKKQAAPVTSWEGLQTALTNGGAAEQNYFIIRLGNDITAGNDDTALLFEYTAHPVLLDLNGHAIDRALTQAAENGNVLTVNGGTLILRDTGTGGSIKGGYNNAPGSGVRVLGGTFTMEGGSITENRTGGVYVATGGVFKLQGGSITGNSTDSNGGGVYVDGGSFLVSGSPTVTGNTDSTQNQSNVYLNTGSVISLYGQLTSGASFGVGAAYEGRFTDDSYNSYTHIDNSFTADNLYWLYQDDNDWPCIEPLAHHPAAPEWTWAENLSTATARAVCQNCGVQIWTREAIPVSFEYNATDSTLYAVATVTVGEEPYTDRKALEPDFVEEQEPRIDETKVYHSGTAAHYVVTAGTVAPATYYFRETEGHPGNQCELSALTLDTFTFENKNETWGITEYTGGFDAAGTYILLPGEIKNPNNPVQTFELTFLGDGVKPFYTLPEAMQASPPEVVITDNGTITSVSANAFAGRQNLILQLRAEDKIISIADGAFADNADVKIQANYTSGLTSGEHTDGTGKYTVELMDVVQYTKTATWAEDYSSAEITISGDNGETHTFPAKRITRTETETEDPQTHEMSITAEGTFEGNTYSVTLVHVPCYSVTVKGTGVLNLPRKVKTDGTYENYAVFYVTQALLDPLAVNTPAGAELAGLKDDSGNDHVVDERVQITQDTTFMASWRSTWAKVQAALSAGGTPQVTLYSDIRPAQGDGYLHVPQGVTATLNLGGYTVNRGLSQSSPIPDGYVIRVDGSLTLKNGIVTGGSNTGDGGGIYLFNGGSLITNNVTVSSNHAQNGGGVYMVDVSQAEFNNSTISYNVANQYGGGLYVGGERPSSNSGPLGDPSGSSNAILSNVSIIHNRAQNAGGLFVNSGEVQLGSNTKIINNTDLDGNKFNNIDVVGGIMNLISGAEGLLLGLPAAAGGVSSLKGWALGLLGALAVGGTIATVIVLDRNKKSIDDDQEEECQTHSLVSDLKWAKDFSYATEYVRCSECGKIISTDRLEPEISVDDDMYTHYKVKPSQKTTDDTDQKVPPYKLVKQANIPEVIDKAGTAAEFVDDVKFIPHGKGQPHTEVLGPSRWQFVENGDKLLFDGWLKDNQRVAQVTFTGPDDQTITVQVHWLLPYGYAPHDSVPYDAVADPAQGSHPLTPEPNPKYVESGAQETVKENQWTRYLYKFTGWRVPLPVKIVKEGLRYKLVYTYVEIDSPEIDDKKKPGDPLRIIGPVILRAEWQSKWKNLGDTLKKAHSFAMTELVTATQSDQTIKVDAGSVGALALDGMILNGAAAPGVQSILNVLGILTIMDLTQAGTITGGHTTTNGGGITIGSDGTLTLQGGNIVSNEAHMLNEKTGNGGGVSVSGNFIMSGGSVKNNTADGNGGGVYIADKAAFAMSGGEISGNKAGGHAGGVYVGGSFSVAGKVIIKDNTVGVNASNVYLPTGKTITVSGKLDDAAEIHVSMQTPGVITSGLNAKGDNQAKGKAENFVSDDPNYNVVINAAGEATLVSKDASPYFSDARLELGGILRMRFYMDYPEGWDATGDSMVFSMAYMDSLTVSYAEAGDDAGRKYFACPVNAYRMADTITAVYYHGGKAISSMGYTIKQYLETMIYSESYNSGDKALAKATANYGHYIQPYLAQTNGWEYGVKYKTMDLCYPDVRSSEETVSGADYPLTFSKEDAYSQYVDKVAFYLTLDSDTLLNVRIYLKNPGDTVTGSVGDKELPQWNRANNSVVVCLEGINAKALDDMYTFECKVNGVPVFTLSASALTFVKRVFPTSTDTVERDALHALYDYAQAAEAYAPSS